MKLEKKLAPGELRFIAKLFDAKKKLWGVYDRGRASWPEQTPQLGVVRQRLKLESDAQAEADRLNKEHPVEAAAEPAKSSKAKKAGKKTGSSSSSSSSETVQATDVAGDDELPELPTYEISEEDRAKYEENLD